MHVQRETSRGPSLSDVLLLLLAGGVPEAALLTAVYTPGPFISFILSIIYMGVLRRIPFKVLHVRAVRAQIKA